MNANVVDQGGFTQAAEPANAPREIILDALAQGSVIGGVLKLDLQVGALETIVASERDLMIIAGDGTTILIENYVAAVEAGVLREVALPNGESLEAPALIEQAIEVDDLSDILSDLETASGDASPPPDDQLPVSFETLTVADFTASGLRSFSATDLTGGGDDDDTGRATGGVTPAVEEAETEDPPETPPAPVPTGPETLVLAVSQGNEDTPVAIDILTPLQALGTVTAATATVSGIPAGATLSAGTAGPGGTVTLQHSDLAGLSITPAPDATGTFSLSVAVTATIDGVERELAGPQALVFHGTAQEGTLTVAAALGIEDTAIPLEIEIGNIEVNDIASVRVSGIPSGAVLNAGTVEPDGATATLTAGQLAGLTVTPPPGILDDFTLSVDLITTDLNSGDTATVARTLQVTVSPVPDGDTVSGGDGDDQLSGSDQGDLIDGGDGGDTIDAGTGDDIVSAGDGEDQVDGGAGNDVVDGGDGNDNLTGGDGNDTLLGGDGTDTIAGGDDGDILDGGGGADNIDGGTGGDILDGGDGNDTLVGGEGDDTLRGGNGDDRLFGSNGNDVLEGGDGFDLLIGDGGDDRLFGGLGTDILRGGADNDVIFGQQGNDTLFGDAGLDTLDGGEGLDLLFGGAGADRYKISVLDGNVDTVQGFNAAEGDVLDISDLISFENGDPLANFVRFNEAGGSTTVQVDTSGSGEEQNFTDAAVLVGVTGLDPSAVVVTQPDGG